MPAESGLSSLLPSAIVLGLAAAIAVYLTATRDWSDAPPDRLRGAVGIAAITVAAQGIHFTEELATGLPERFPALFGFPPVPVAMFVTFNLAWFVVWILALGGLARRVRVALLPLWFLGLAEMVNLIAHPALAIRAGGYFPGLATSLPVGVCGILLFRRLLAVTRVVGP